MKNWRGSEVDLDSSVDYAGGSIIYATGSYRFISHRPEGISNNFHLLPSTSSN